MPRIYPFIILALASAILSASAQTAVVDRIVVQYATGAELDSVVLDKGHAVLNDSNPNDLRIGDGVTRGGRRIYQPDWTNQNMLAQWGGLSRWEVESLLAFSLGDVSSWVSGTFAPVKQAADAAFSWGNHAVAGYLKSEADTAALSAISSMPTGFWNQAYAWGNHATAGYLSSGQNMLTQWGGLSSYDIESLLALSIGYNASRIKPPTSTNGLTSGELWNSNGVAHFIP